MTDYSVSDICNLLWQMVTAKVLLNYIYMVFHIYLVSPVTSIKYFSKVVKRNIPKIGYLLERDGSESLVASIS